MFPSTRKREREPEKEKTQRTKRESELEKERSKRRSVSEPNADQRTQRRSTTVNQTPIHRCEANADFVTNQTPIQSAKQMPIQSAKQMPISSHSGHTELTSLPILHGSPITEL